jgi:hypothetical protein
MRWRQAQAGSLGDYRWKRTSYGRGNVVDLPLLTDEYHPFGHRIPADFSAHPTGSTAYPQPGALFVGAACNGAKGWLQQIRILTSINDGSRQQS